MYEYLTEDDVRGYHEWHPIWMTEEEAERNCREAALDVMWGDYCDKNDIR